jgi:hypothetical protein
MFNNEYVRLLLIVLIAVGLAYLYKTYVLDDSTHVTSTSTSTTPANATVTSKLVLPTEHFESEMVGGASVDDVSGLKSVANKVKYNHNTLEHPQPSNSHHELSNNVQYDHTAAFPADELTAHDLLPSNSSHWEASNPTVPGHLNDKNFCDSGHHYGINTVGSSLRNANRQIRSDPLIRKQQVGPWNQSTVEPDHNRKTFEVGEV